MLSLASTTGAGWADRAAAATDLLLLDHAHCEKKAASTAVNLLFRYPEVAGLSVPLARIAREELEHFERVVDLCARRGLRFRRIPPSPYAGRLGEAVRTFEPARLLDTLLVCALIEARSCERMGILAERLEDPELRDLYGGLLESEARHHGVYVDLARGTSLFSEQEIRERLAALAEHEAHVMRGDPEPVRMHSR
jgi:tRNA 2-(methylsulfanyl)-N6-isopentenyladenosine37 hydroxylase